MNSPLRVLAIVNPSAGRKRASRSWLSVKARLPPDTTIHIAKNAEDSEHQARTGAVEGFDVVLAAGGDGTIHHVVNGLMAVNRNDVTLGIAPIGTANDFVAGVGLTGESVAATPPWGSRITIDIGMVESPAGRDGRRFFCNAMGVGLPAAVAMHVRHMARLHGRWAYTAALLRSTVSDFRWPSISWEMDNHSWQEEPTLSLTAALGPRQGSFVLAPDARFTDGHFDVLHVGKLGRPGLVRYFPRLISGNIPKNDPAIREARCNSFKINESSEPLTVHLDGEIFATKTDDCRCLSVSLIPQRLPVLLI